jgi:hypothetical protein
MNPTQAIRAMENTNSVELPFLAGLGSNGDPVFETIPAEYLAGDPQRVRLLRSPLFARNLASGDTIKLINPAIAQYELERRSGNLCVRVFRKLGIGEVDDFLTPLLEKLGGARDLVSERGIVYSVHVSLGFKAIEELLDAACTVCPDTVWYYGNVYDPEDGVTPLQWWLEFDTQE